jgi:hypothetical protein
MNGFSYPVNPVGWVDPRGLEAGLLMLPEGFAGKAIQEREQYLTPCNNSDFCKELCYAASHEKNYSSPDEFAKAIFNLSSLEKDEHQFLHNDPTNKYHYSDGGKEVDIQYTLIGWAAERQATLSADPLYVGYSLFGRGAGGSINEYDKSVQRGEGKLQSVANAVLAYDTNMHDQANLAGLAFGRDAASYPSFSAYANKKCGCP